MIASCLLTTKVVLKTAQHLSLPLYVNKLTCLTLGARISFKTTTDYTSTTKSFKSDASSTIKTRTMNKAWWRRSSRDCRDGSGRDRRSTHFSCRLQYNFSCFCEAIALRIITSKLITEWFTRNDDCPS